MSLFEKLSKIDVNKHKKKKGQFDYLSWPLAIQELLKVALMLLGKYMNIKMKMD